MAEWRVEAAFTIAGYSAQPGPLWLAVSVCDHDGQPINLQFPAPADPNPQWPLVATVMLSQVGGGAYADTKVVGASMTKLGFYLFDIVNQDEELASLADLRPLVIAVEVQVGADRGQTLAYAAQAMLPWPFPRP